MNIYLIFRLCVIFVLSFMSASVLAQDQTVNQTCSFKLLLSDNKSQIAIWITDEYGSFVDTVYVTRKIAQKDLGIGEAHWMTNGEAPD